MRSVVGHIKAVDGVSDRLAQGRDPRCGRQIRYRQDDAGLGVAAANLVRKARSFSWATSSKVCGSSRCARSGATCRSCFRNPTARCRRACRSPTSSRRGSRYITPRMSERERDERVNARACRCRAQSRPCASVSTKSPAASASALRWRAPSCSSHLCRARRTDQCARYADPGADGRSAAPASETHNLTYLFISHDLRVVAALASRLLVMRQGKVVESGAAAELFRDRKPTTRGHLFAAAFNLEAAPG